MWQPRSRRQYLMRCAAGGSDLMRCALSKPVQLVLLCCWQRCASLMMPQRACLPAGTANRVLGLMHMPSELSSSR